LEVLDNVERNSIHEVKVPYGLRSLEYDTCHVKLEYVVTNNTDSKLRHEEEATCAILGEERRNGILL